VGGHVARADPVAAVESRAVRPLGYYESRAANATLEIPTRAWGARLYGGYRIGAGDVPSYESGRLTDGDGELRAGLELPLLRDGATDPARAKIERARIDLQRMTPEIELERIEIERAAAVAYWDWVAAGRRLEIASQLLAIARERQSQIAGRVERGAEPRIDLTDNQRLIVERESTLRGARRDFEQAAIRLSIYWRDDAGEPRRPGSDRLPRAFPDEQPIDRLGVESDLDHARRDHPLLRQLGLDRDRLAVDLALARNQLLPGLDVRVEGAQDLGASRSGIDETGSRSGSPRSSTELKALLAFEMPIQLREARGRKAAASARIARIDARLRLARDRVIADALQALESLEAAFDQTLQARENVRLAETLRDAEARRFASGLSNLIDVNIREVQAATAARQLVDAQAAYFRSLADYRARIARPPDGEPTGAAAPMTFDS
ncbi:MAG TPA: TolC family protein, partial [Myxococcota bacterium]|nr:TolC family protein [Myxococcota bacterium]